MFVSLVVLFIILQHLLLKDNNSKEVSEDAKLTSFVFTVFGVIILIFNII